jgi:hypothetical protein
MKENGSFMTFKTSPVGNLQTCCPEQQQQTDFPPSNPMPRL